MGSQWMSGLYQVSGSVAVQERRPSTSGIDPAGHARIQRGIAGAGTVPDGCSAGFQVLHRPLPPRQAQSASPPAAASGGAQASPSGGIITFRPPGGFQVNGMHRLARRSHTACASALGHTQLPDQRLRPLGAQPRLSAIPSHISPCRHDYGDLRMAFPDLRENYNSRCRRGPVRHLASQHVRGIA